MFLSQARVHKGPLTWPPGSVLIGIDTSGSILVLATFTVLGNSFIFTKGSHSFDHAFWTRGCQGWNCSDVHHKVSRVDTLQAWVGWPGPLPPWMLADAVTPLQSQWLFPQPRWHTA